MFSSVPFSLTSLGSSRIVEILACPESSFQGFVSTPVSSLSRLQQIRIPDVHWHEHVVVLRVCFPRRSSFDRLVCKRGCSIFLLMPSSSAVSSRKWLPVLLCADQLCLGSKLQASSLCPVVSLHLFVFRWLLGGILLLVFIFFWYCRVEKLCLESDRPDGQTVHPRMESHTG